MKTQLKKRNRSNISQPDKRVRVGLTRLLDDFIGRCLKADHDAYIQSGIVKMKQMFPELCQKPHKKLRKQNKPPIRSVLARPTSSASPSHAPQQLGKYDWYYEYPTYITLVHETRGEQGGYLKTDQIKIPWRKLEASLRRCRPNE